MTRIAPQTFVRRYVADIWHFFDTGDRQDGAKNEAVAAISPVKRKRTCTCVKTYVALVLAVFDWPTVTRLVTGAALVLPARRNSIVRFGIEVPPVSLGKMVTGLRAKFYPPTPGDDSNGHLAG
ncbi:hypothetical protein KM043_005463 [Ampulex compressa]|nr:hypothetical protein KM043_005463 [Ampulex compressa]